MHENPRAPVDTLTAAEGATVRRMLRDLGPEQTCKLLGITTATAYKAASEAPIARLTAAVIRQRLGTYRTQVSESRHSTRTA